MHDLRVWDADNHLYETTEAFTRHLPAAYAGAIRYVEVEGRTKIVIKNQISDYIPNPTFDVVASPGAWENYFRGINPAGKSLRELANPIRCPKEFRDPDQRITVLDRQGVEATLMFPTLASLLENRLSGDIDLTHEVIHALNQWIYDEWSFNHHDRIFAVPIITLPDPLRAVEELEWVVERGARTVLVRPAPVPTRDGRSDSPGKPYYDPFWKAVQQIGIPVMMHGSDSGYDRRAQEWDGPRDEYLPFRPDPFRLAIDEGRPIHDTMAALICHGMFDRNPGVRVAAVETGTHWVPRLLKNLTKAFSKAPGEFGYDPVERFRENVWVHPFHEDDVAAVVDLVGEDHVLFGSDYPHPEGLADPISFLDELTDLDETVQAKIMGGNLRDLLTARPAA